MVRECENPALEPYVAPPDPKPAGEAIWGGITGTITDQTDLIEYIASHGGGGEVLVDDFTIGKNAQNKVQFKVKSATDKDKVWKVDATGDWDLTNINEWQEVNTFVGVTPNEYTLYILLDNVTISDVDYKKGFYIYRDSEYVRVTHSVDDYTLEIDDDNNITFKEQTANEEKQVWRVKNDGTWELDDINEWEVISTFAGKTLNGHTLYLLTSNVTVEGVDYVKGFYTYDETEEEIVARHLEIQLDEETTEYNSDNELQANAIIELGSGAFPVTDIKTKTYYRKSETVTWTDAEEVEHSFTMTKLYLYVSGAWVSQVNIELTNEQYSHLTAAQKQDGTVYIVNNDDGTTIVWDYATLANKPRIDGLTLLGDLTHEDLNLYNRTEINNLLEGKGQPEFVSYLPVTTVANTWYYSAHFQDGTLVPNDNNALYITDKDNVLHYMGVVGQVTAGVTDIKVDGRTVVDGQEVNFETDTDAVDDMFDTMPDIESVELSDLVTNEDKTAETLSDNTHLTDLNVAGGKNKFYKLLQVWDYITTKTASALTTTAKTILGAINENKANADGRSRLVGVFSRTANFNISQNTWTPVNFNANDTLDTNFVKPNGNYIQIVKTGVYKFTVTARLQDGAGGHEWAVAITNHQDDLTGGAWFYTVNRHKVQATFIEYYTAGQTIRPEIYIATHTKVLSAMTCAVEYTGR